MTEIIIKITDRDLSDILSSLLDSISDDETHGWCACSKDKQETFNKLIPEYNKAFPDSTLHPFII